MNSRSYAKINLNNLIYNIDNIYEYSGHKKILAIIKANGYGHGAVEISKAIEQKDCILGFGVAAISEALELRKNGISKIILNLGGTFEDEFDNAINNNIEMTVYSLEIAKMISKHAVSLNKTAFIQIKIDTGMSRLGFLPENDTIQKIKEILKLPNIKITGMYTHFAKADENDSEFTNKQLERYLWVKHQLDSENIKFDYYHCFNSAAVLRFKCEELNVIRPGYIIYGLYTSNDKEYKSKLRLKPVLSLYSHVSFVKNIPENTPVGYGSTFVSEKKMKIATIAIGYADGYPLSLSNKGYVLIHGEKANIVGKVCMDQIMVDVSNIDNVKFGDSVTLIGQDTDKIISVNHISETSGRFFIEFTSLLTGRVSMEYVYE